MNSAAHSLSHMRDLIPDFKHPKILELAEYWMSIHPGDRLPSRKDLDPIDILSLLPNLVLVDVETDPYRFLARVQGTEVSRAMKMDLTGRYLHDVFADFDQTFPYKDRVKVVETGCAVHRFGSPSLPFALDFVPIERLHVPFSSDGEKVDKVLSIFLYEQKHKLVERTF